MAQFRHPNVAGLVAVVYENTLSPLVVRALTNKEKNKAKKLGQGALQDGIVLRFMFFICVSGGFPSTACSFSFFLLLSCSSVVFAHFFSWPLGFLHIFSLLFSSFHATQLCEFAAQGPLDRYLRLARPEVTVKLAMASDVAAGLAYLAACSFLSGDLAARTILVDEHKVCKLAGFGITRDVTDPEHHVGRLAIRWAAPELYPKRSVESRSRRIRRRRRRRKEKEEERKKKRERRRENRKG